MSGSSDASSGNLLIAGVLSAIFATILWSGNFVVSRMMVDEIPPVTLAFLRWSTAALLLLPFSARSVWRHRSTIRSHIGYLLLVSLLGVTLFNTLIYMAGASTTAIKMSLIAITFPLFIVIFSALFLSEALSRNRLLGIMLVAVGVTYLVTDGAPSQLLQLSLAIGDLWMLLAAILFAIYSILVRHKPATLNSMTFLSTTFLLGLLLLTPWMIWEQLHHPWPTLSTTSMTAVLYLGLFASIGSYLFWNRSVALIGPSNAGMIYYSLPLFSGVLAYWILGEAITLIHWTSAILILSGIYLSTILHRPTLN